jgi:hypothetical protein
MCVDKFRIFCHEYIGEEMEDSYFEYTCAIEMSTLK